MKSHKFSAQSPHETIDSNGYGGSILLDVLISSIPPLHVRSTRSCSKKKDMAVSFQATGQQA